MNLSPSSLVKNEPVLVAHFVAWLLLQAGLILVGRYHVLSSSNWSALSSALAPVVTAVFLALVAWLLRHVVTPAWKWVSTEVGPAAAGDVEKALASAQATYPMPVTGTTGAATVVTNPATTTVITQPPAAPAAAPPTAPSA